MDLEDIILILINKSGKSRHEIMTLIEKKQLESGGTISTKAAATLVSRDLDIKISEIVTTQPNKIKDLLIMAPGSSNITITAFIKRLYHFNSFIHENEERFVQNMFIADETDSIRVTLWGSMVKLVSNLNLKKGDQIRLVKGRLKNGKFGERELHLGDTSTIERVASGTDLLNGFIWQDVFFPGSLSPQHYDLRELDIQGVIIDVKDTNIENRPAKITIIDPETTNVENSIEVNFWKERKMEVKDLQIAQKVLLEGVGIKEGLQQKPEIHFNRNSNITIISKGSEAFKAKIIKQKKNHMNDSEPRDFVNKTLGEIKPQEFVELLVKVNYMGNIVQFKRKDGSEGQVIRIGIFDNEGSNFLVLWDEKVDLMENIQVGDSIKVTGCYLRQNKGNYELSLTRNGSISKVENLDNVELPDTIPKVEIQDISNKWKSVSLIGEVNQISDVRVFKRNDGSEGRVKNMEIADHSGEIKIVAWNDKIEDLASLNLGDYIEIKNLSIRNNNYGQFEGHLNQNSVIRSDLSPDVINKLQNISYKLPVYKTQPDSNFHRVKLEDFSDDLKEKISEKMDLDEKSDEDLVEFRASIVEVFENPLYYNACVLCSKKVDVTTSDKGNCPNHNEVEFLPKLLFRVLVDDGTNVFNITFIGSMAERLTGLKPHHVRKLLNSFNNNDQLLYQYIKSKIIGNEYFLKGRLATRTSTNESGERVFWDFKLAFIAQANAKEELKELLINK